jgi:CubicO group peptidase (beta-lactamase class C family)
MSRSSFLRSLLFVACTFTAFAAETTFAEAAERRLREATKGESSGVAVLVAREGKIVFQGGFGFADLAQKTPITTETKFRIGSVSKQFTAAAILRLAEDGKLTLGDSLTKYFPEFANGENVTLRHLLTHTSGLQSYTSKQGFLNRVTKPIAPADLIAWFRDDRPNFPPGAGFRYNNSAYFLLGEIIARVSGKSYGEYLRETFFDPIGMKETGVFQNNAPPEGMAVGYSFADGKTSVALDWDMTWAGAAGALYSTVGDLFLWNEALFNGRVVNSASFKAATTPVELPRGIDGMKYGYGLVMSQLKRLPVISHSGGLNGWSSDLLRLPEQKCTVVALVNASPPPPGLTPGSLTRSLAEQFLADEIKKLPPLQEDTSVDPKTFAAYEGRYRFPPNAVLTVTQEGAALFAQLTNQSKFRIYPKGGDEFFWKVVDAQIVFLRDENGEVYAAEQTQNGRSVRTPKMRESAAIPAKTEVR